MFIALQFDPTISFGTVVEIGAIIITVVGLYYGVVGKLELFKQTLEQHAVQIADHTRRMEKNEDMFSQMAADFHRLMGRIEANDRRHVPRT